MRTGRPMEAPGLQAHAQEQATLELMVQRPKTDQRTALGASSIMDRVAIFRQRTTHSPLRLFTR